MKLEHKYNIKSNKTNPKKKNPSSVTGQTPVPLLRQTLLTH